MKLSKQQKRDELITSHLYLVKQVIRRFATRMPEYIFTEDMHSTGVIGLITAANNFDPSRNTQFKTFAERRIKGAILDYLRDNDNLSRSKRKKFKDIEKAVISMEHELLREISPIEVVDKLNMHIDEIYDVLHQALKGEDQFSIDEGLDEEHGWRIQIWSDIDTPEDILIMKQFIDYVTKFLEMYSPREQLIFSLYYYESLNLREIGYLLDLTESRISQILHKIIETLINKLNGDNSEI